MMSQALQNFGSSQERKLKRKLCINLTLILITLFLSCLLIGAALLLPDIIDKQMNEQIDSNIVMTAQNQQRWSSIPGENDVFIERVFTFYQIQDPFAFFFYNQSQLTVSERGPFHYKEFMNMTELSFSQDKSVIYFNRRQYFVPINNTQGDERVEVLNFAPLGLIYSAKHSNMSVLSLNALSEMVMGIANSIYQTLIRNGIDYQVFNSSQDRKKGNLAMDQGRVPVQIRQAIWNDKFNGWNDSFSRMPWVVAALEGKDGGGSKFLQDYFKLSDGEFSPLFDLFQEGVQLVNSTTAYNHYCNETAFRCDKHFLVAKQWSKQGCSLYPPPGTTIPLNSTADTNKTAFGYLELSYYLKYGSLLPEKVRNVQFPIEWAVNFLYFNDDQKNFARNQSNIFNIGNMNFMWEKGEEFDKNTSDTSQLEMIRKRFKLNSTQQSWALWDYIQYQVNVIGFNLTQGGSRTISVVSQYSAPLIAKGFITTYDYLLPTIYKNLYYYNITQEKQNCYGFFELIDDIEISKLDLICSMKEFVDWNIDSMDYLDDLCWGQSDDFYQNFQNITQLTNLQIINFCDPKIGRLVILNFYCKYKYFFFPQKFKGSMLDHYGTKLSLLYNCSNLGRYCSKHEIALKQWAYSLISLNPPEEIQNVFSPTASIYFWNQSLFPNPWEYSYFTNIHKDYKGKSQKFTDDELRVLLNWNRLFSQTIVSEFMRNFKLGDFKQIKEKLFFDESTAIQLVDYVRYLFLYSKLGGITVGMTVDQVLFGRNDPFIQEMSEQDPQKGGDPSIDYFVKLNDNNDTQADRFSNPQAFYTGRDDIKQTRFFHSINGKNYITVKKSWFDGERVHSEYLSPWKENITIEGTDSSQNIPHMNSESQMKVLVTSLSRQGGGKPTGVQKDIGGIEVWQFQIGDDIYNSSWTFKNNTIYYQNQYDGLINLTSVKRVPIFISQKRMFKVNESLATRINYLDQNGNKLLASEADESRLYLEPNTGVPFEVELNAQANLLIEPDELFPIGSNLMVPIFNTYRSTNLKQSVIDDNYSQLSQALKFKKLTPIIGYSVGGFLFLIALILAYHRYLKAI